MTHAPDTLTAALLFAGNGWPVFPASPQHKRPLLAAEVDSAGNKIRGTGGVSAASRDADQICAWWAKWPRAMVGVATGFDRLFVLDFDPRVDEATGEVFELAGLKAALEAQMGCALPDSLTSITQSGGVHVWLRWPDDGGAPVRNRGNLPAHVDVRGLGGYVIAPPSVMASGASYRWRRRGGVADDPVTTAIAEAPAELVAILRSMGNPIDRDKPPPPLRGTPPSPAATGGIDDRADTARRKYALAAIDGIAQRIRSAGSGARNAELNSGAFAAAALVAAGALDSVLARSMVEAAARANPGRDDAGQLAATIDSGWSAGLAQPADLSQVGTQVSTAARHHRGDAARSTFTPPARSTGAQRGGSALPNGSQPVIIPAGARGAVLASGARWAGQRFARLPDACAAWDGEGFSPPLRMAFAIGSRCAAAMMPPLLGLSYLAGIAAMFDLPADGLLLAAQDGMDRPADPAALVTDYRCSQLPLTDLGNAERFVERCGDDFRYTTAKGWLGWDGRRWAVLDQEQDATPAAVKAAIFATIRAVQDEARLVLDSPMKMSGGLDYITRETKSSVIYFSDDLRAHGRASESAGRLGCIAGLAQRWMTVPIDDFDHDPFAINVLNGTVRLVKGDDGAPALRLDAHRRADLIAKLAPVVFDPDRAAPAPLFDAMIEWAQPDAKLRRYIRQWLGYSATGHVGAQILHFWYGLGANGKSTAIDVVAAALGDYAGTIGIESFLDQGIKKRGDAATPDLARLGGVRLLRASEPDQKAKLNEALIKAATGGEPMAVRALHKGFFDLRPQFKLTLAGNHRPDIPGTDEGIWRRIKLVPWEQSLAPEARDADLLDKMKGLHPDVDGELDGIFAWIMAGLVDWRANGFVEPDAVRDATSEYRDNSDPLARFLRLCTRFDAGARVQSSHLFSVFEAWARAAGEVEWKPKGFAKAMESKGFKKTRSNGMQWEGIALIKAVHDFVDADGRVIDQGDAAAGAAPRDDELPDGRPAPPPSADDYAGWDAD
jgi:putative DNA primase/helicase